MKKYKFSGTSFIVNDYIGKSNVWDLENKKIKQHSLMNSDEILQWINEGMHIGSHGLSHSNLIKEIDSVAISEIANSKLLLEKNFNIEIDTFCYPFGAYNDAIIELVKGAGYKFAVTTKRGRLKNLNEHAYEIPRVPIGNNIGYFKFLLKTITNYEDL